ncbi:hypothetical protein Hbor_28470 [Halogeometricum borinquense DSM 11551]|uniref:Uncharacterized protein n=1 Tax=Halogeometricum borinquense (strain ATCC 700274 / DSM 11551 / JCM 10706 / KCTC 4070 / PR3) TaxID=469382 RepID=E4NLT8_HALBP|nr:hypothetical protein Hbor_28470 [Halogeometricum borinquense DSM 11551]
MHLRSEMVWESEKRDANCVLVFRLGAHEVSASIPEPMARTGMTTFGKAFSRTS